MLILDDAQSGHLGQEIPVCEYLQIEGPVLLLGNFEELRGRPKTDTPPIDMTLNGSQLPQDLRRPRFGLKLLVLGTGMNGLVS